MTTKTQSTRMEPTKANLHLVIEEVRGIMETGRKLRPANPFSEGNMSKLGSLQMWVRKILKGDPAADLAKTMASAIGLRSRLHAELDEYLDGALDRFMATVKQIRSLAPDLYEANESEITLVIADLTAASQQGGDEYDAMIAAHNKCHDVVIPLMARAKDARLEAERAEKQAKKEEKERAAALALEEFVSIEFEFDSVA